MKHPPNGVVTVRGVVVQNRGYPGKRPKICTKILNYARRATRPRVSAVSFLSPFSDYVDTAGTVSLREELRVMLYRKMPGLHL